MDSPLLLVAEDNDDLQAVLCDALEEAGYAVVSASRGSQALQLLDEYGSAVRGLITDINLGDEPTGWDVARRARELIADVAVVYVTGGAGHEWVARGVPGSVLVPKPWVPAQIVTAISGLLTITRPQQIPE